MRVLLRFPTQRRRRVAATLGLLALTISATLLTHRTLLGRDAGVTLIQHPTIAARDAYAARGGWIADREMTAITYSDQHGQVARATVRPEML